MNYLKAGYSCTVIPGGVQEMAYLNKDYDVSLSLSLSQALAVSLSLYLAPFVYISLHFSLNG